MPSSSYGNGKRWLNTSCHPTRFWTCFISLPPSQAVSSRLIIILPYQPLVKVPTNRFLREFCTKILYAFIVSSIMPNYLHSMYLFSKYSILVDVYVSLCSLSCKSKIRLCLCLIQHHAMKMCATVEAWLQSFLNFVPDTRRMFSFTRGWLYRRGKEPRHPSYKDLNWSQSWSVCDWRI
jgi:hypothetical protein